MGQSQWIGSRVPEIVRKMETDSPFISVIICTYNRCESLVKTLEGLARMSILPDLMWELIVVDNNSSDHTSETVKSLINRETSLRLKYVFEPVPGLSQARNRGVRESQGTILAFLDDDVLVSSEWLTEVRSAFQQYDPVCVGGRVLLCEDRPRPSWWDKAYDPPVGKFDRGTSVIVYQESDERLIGIGANMMFKRIAFDRYGLFRTDLGKKENQQTTGEETDMVQRLRKQKERIIYYPNALVYHCPSAERFSKRYLRRHFYGLGQWSFLTELEGPNTAPRILGIPRWRYRSVLANIWKTVLLGLRGRYTESFIQQLQLAFFLGYFRAARKVETPARRT
jgi:glucosyl-dolichyl phosphate glucuronosyltransferase